MVRGFVTVLCNAEFSKRPLSSTMANQTSPDFDKLLTAITLLEKILQNGTNENRKYCKYCKIIMKSPTELHKTDCTWRLAWELVNGWKEQK